MISRSCWTIAIPLLVWMMPYNTALAASASGTCSDGHKVSASTGNNAGSCKSTSADGHTTGVFCDDGKGNSGAAECGGTVASSGSGTSAGRDVQSSSGGEGSGSVTIIVPLPALSTKLQP
jgi:hypothetical protein